MATGKIGYIIVGLLVLVGGAWWAVSASNRQIISQEQSSNIETSINEENNFSGDFKTLVTKSGSHKCEMNSSTNGVTTSGVFHISDGRVRGDFSSVVPQYGSIESHMILKDGFVYVWSSMAPRGFKFAVAADGEVNTQGNPQADALLNTNYSYSCVAATVASSHFDLPAGITF